ncbi:MAG: hypothetical protein B7Y41_10620 [Hydrogenophilales bacterium 28-61-23]|nr:MAG: hypothetical protein B7Y41_10620 [Hydrogenophilales bacterium 28-61-23]
MNKLLTALFFSATCAFAAQGFAADTGAAQSAKSHDGMVKSHAGVAKKSTHAPAHHQKAGPKKSETPAPAK